MTTILSVFIIALIISLAITPLAGVLGERFGALDIPIARKVHTRPVPRSGGLAMIVAFLFALALSALITTDVTNKLILDRETGFFLLGALIIFGVGFFDDFHRLGPKIKFIFQIIGASFAFWGGLRIESLFGFDISFQPGILSYSVTVFWFVLFINAVNLIDGLDGLAAGVTFFTSVVLIILSVLKGEYLMAMLLGAFSGAILGFLRYNFNPASIFMGDGGSYFLGYTIAGLSVMGSVKCQAGAAMMIPLLGLGLPVFDAILSPVRRFVLGKHMFWPDKDHIHHKLVSMGLSTKNTVLTIYGISLFLCLLAVITVNFRDEQAGFFLIVLGAGSVISVKRLGYFEYITHDKINGWFKDIADEAGISHDRRSFLSLQFEIGKSKSFEELRQNIIRALEVLEFDYAAFYLNNGAKNKGSTGQLEISSIRNPLERRKTPAHRASVSTREEPPAWDWARGPFNGKEDTPRCFLFRLELPLSGAENANFGSLVLLKDLKQNSLSHYTLRRVEHLRRTIINTLETRMAEAIRHVEM
ncbi:MAG: undecaprenyl/decaprenyl-phosphate alpha-N-acetylglucosaminyl 1-phosphate transferase [Deltaproteobacteria bacterium]|nr:undecaprenyl/decaprenyl-phosphate alpha-N-acetylglucosaminyl 1-phosphate transferase [Deltaproteobacteria bacterium]